MASILVCGAFPGTGNLGVNALGTAFISEYRKARPNDKIFIQTLDGGVVETFIEDEFGKFSFSTLPIRPTKKIYREDSVFRYKLGSYVSFSSKLSRIFNSIDCVVDVAGGDSFTDLYGYARFNLINAVKDLCILYRKPYVCLPQTYGPFSSGDVLLRAKNYVNRSISAWARDDDSYKVLTQLADSDISTPDVRVGVDMAFQLPTRSCEDKLSPAILETISGERSVVGINVSGLIYNSPKEAVERYNFICDYRKLVKDYISWLLKSTDVVVVLIPHVLVELTAPESDYNACLEVAKSLGDPDRLLVQSPCLDECESKWLISKMDFFMGTRMHATIAGLSSSVPTCTISYSNKALGVFRSCGVEDQVFDPRVSSHEEILLSLQHSFHNREEIKKRLCSEVLLVKSKAVEQIADIAEVISKELN